MNQHQQRDLQTLMERWREQPPQPGELSEELCIALLKEIEQRKDETADASYNQAEAILLAGLSFHRLGKPGGQKLAEEWLERAIQLFPDYQPALELRLRLAVSQLREHPFGAPYPVFRETDNVVARRRSVEVLAALVQEQLSLLPGWRAQAAEAAQLARRLEQHQVAAAADGLERLYGEREALLGQVQELGEAYAASLSGVFFSAELLARLQAALRALDEQREQREALLKEIEPQPAERAEEKRGQSALEQLEKLVGLEEIKQRVRQLAQFLQYRQKREEKGWQMQDELPLHLVLMGNPGTGKTTLARLIAQLYKELGLLSQGQLVEVDRSHLVGAYVGQTEQRVMDAVKRADGGVLFIDEAYSLKRPDSSGSDYGQVAIDTLVAAMTGGEYAGRFVVMLAGYPEEMRHFLYANPGLRSRFPETGHFVLPDYTSGELLQIADQVASRNDFLLTEEARRQLRQRLEKARVDETFGNARTVTNLILDAIFAKGRAAADGDLQWDDYTVLYPEDVSEPERAADQQPASAALQELVGLSQVKAEIARISAFVTVQKERAARGLPMSPVELHAVFTGNPGTGKTTVARLYAQILQEIGYLKRGHLVVASRADLVAGYVGQTAALTRRKVREALGGVLFIDEAYALFGGGVQDFGQEAVHTLVEEMTRHGENLVVVLAGYPAEMTSLLMSNPGLLSRFKKYIHFPDYSVAELVQILQQSASAAGYRIGSDTLARITQRLEEMAQGKGIEGNGRFSRNLLQEAMQNQALRLTSLPREDWSEERLGELAWEDFRSILEQQEPQG